MTIIGITGGIGSGKSYVCQALRKRGYAVYDTDSRAKTLMVEDAQVRAELIALFGEEVFRGGELDRKRVASIVFHEPEQLSRLNAIVHPAVIADVQRWAEEQRGYCCFVESALLYPSGLARLCDRIVIVSTPDPTRIARILARDYAGADTAQNRHHIQARIRAQAAYYEPDVPADLLLNGDGSIPIEERIEQILRLVKI
ncbi:MAG: dephospho-CoA kinase [Paludibacteraceae bacterium]|nr:dephospho-CoA kinase [Paludibacteraceae bacterium]